MLYSHRVMWISRQAHDIEILTVLSMSPSEPQTDKFQSPVVRTPPCRPTSKRHSFPKVHILTSHSRLQPKRPMVQRYVALAMCSITSLTISETKVRFLLVELAAHLVFASLETLCSILGAAIYFFGLFLCNHFLFPFISSRPSHSQSTQYRGYEKLRPFLVK